jgi:Peptidase family S41
MRSVVRPLYLITSLLLTTPGFAQQDERLLEVWQMSDDLDSLYAQILSAHPDPFFFATPYALAKAYYNICDSLTAPRTLFSFAALLNQLTSTIEDSHTGIDYGQLTKIAFASDKRILPINVWTNEDGKLIVKNAWDTLITPGWELQCINGVEASIPYSIGYQRFSYTEGDAIIGKQRVADALWPVIAANTLTLDTINSIELLHPTTGEIKVVDAKGYADKEYYKLKKLRAKTGAFKSLEFEIVGDLDYAYLRVGTFAPNASDKYKKRIKQAFKEIKNSGVHHLILDLTGNSGGSSSNVEYLYSFIDSLGYNTPNNVIGINSRLSQKRAGLASGKFVKWILRNLWYRDEDVVGYLQIADLPLGERDTAYFNEPTIQKSKHVFNGKVYLLINGLTASAGVDFTNAFLSKSRGLIIGEACMGPKTGTFGNPASFQLPNSQLSFYIATIRYNYDQSFAVDRNPIQPHIQANWKSEDIENKRNSFKEEAIRIIREK